ncbi:MAG: diguanylate cyclase [Thermoleophilaceae bacterium]|nr:diguanylate cyclase [Thermoleophilaceae bacterium]
MRIRDQAAEGRDCAADMRDREAEGRDRAANDREGADRRSSMRTSEQVLAARDREEAVRDRAAASRDRERAAEDRQQAARDRAESGIDGLTGTLRRDRGVVDLQREIDRAHRSDGRFVLAFVDVDGLKAINDLEGHAAGDQLLRAVGDALRTGLRSYDLVVRYGGDEFLCALPGTNLEGARRRFDEVAQDLTERSPGASVSIGLAALENTDTLGELITRADTDLYAGRRGARGPADSQPRRRFAKRAQ